MERNSLIRAVGILAFMAAGCSAVPSAPVRPEVSPTNIPYALVIEPPTIEPPTLIPSITSTLTETPTSTSTDTPTETTTPTHFQAEIEKCKHLTFGDVGCLYAEGKKGNIMNIILTTSVNNKATSLVDEATSQKGKASLWGGTNVKLVLAHFEIDGYEFDEIGNETVYYIKSDGTWETYQVTSRVNFWDINGGKQFWSRSSSLITPFISSNEIEQTYWNENMPKGNVISNILRLETCIMGPPPSAYTIAKSDPITEIGVTITTLKRTYPDSSTPTQ
jgi:hypothetical protein